MKLFIWDFHGTLERGNELSTLLLTNMALEQHGFSERLSQEDNEAWYGIKWHEYFARLLPNETSEIHYALVKTCLVFARSDPDRYVGKYVEQTNHASEVLSKISKQSHDQILLSNTQPDALDNYLRWTRLEKFFLKDKRFAMNLHDGSGKKTKPDIVREYTTLTRPDTIVVIGDSPHDISIAHGENVVSYLYAHHGRKFRDENCNPTYKIRDLREILREV